MDYLKYIKWALLLCAVLSVIIVDQIAGNSRSRNQIIENQRDVKMVWDVSRRLVEIGGFETLPIQEQELWETLDIYAVESENALFATLPRFPKMRTRVQRMMDGDNITADCWTEQVKLARNGESGVGVFDDYRGVSVISAYGIVIVEDREYILLVEMDESEALSIAPPNYWDECMVFLFCAAVSVIIFYVHKKRARSEADLKKLEEAALGVIAKNKQLEQRLKAAGDSNKKDSFEELSDMLEEQQTVSEWNIQDLEDDADV